MLACQYRPLQIASVAFILATIAVMAASPASAQQNTTSPNALLSLEQTRTCVCLEDEIARIRGGADPRALEDEYKRLTALLEQARGNMDYYDQAQVDSFRRIHERREQVRLALRAPGRDGASMAVRFNVECANRRMLKVNVDAVRANPQCPPL